ncbi:MAG: hypothetical protein ABR949_13030 [Candidatus Aquilonibacter sp.]|jgi:hypothetical protein
MLTACTASRGLVPGPTPFAPGALAISPTSLSFTATGAANAQTVNVSQPGYTNGAFTAATTTCNGIVTVASAGNTAFTFTPVAAGTCTYQISGGNGITATLSIVVTTTAVGGS